MVLKPRIPLGGYGGSYGGGYGGGGPGKSSFYCRKVAVKIDRQVKIFCFMNGYFIFSFFKNTVRRWLEWTSG